MKQKLLILEKHYGHPDKVAEALGISSRQYARIRKSANSTATIKILINELAAKIKYYQFHIGGVPCSK